MSFGLSSGGGQVRYALIVDDQATAKLNTFKNSLTSLGTSTTTTSRGITSLNNSFSAGLVPIKNTGSALSQLTTTQKTLGSQLGGIASGFKNNALAIGAAASSVLGLYQNYANLSSAQNAANKSSTAAKAAQNNLTKAQDNLNKTIDKYGAGSKEAKAAQDKLTVAQERAVNKTESAKIAQDNLNQTMADFGINILPNIVLAGGSIVSIFDNIGGKADGLTGTFSKLKGSIGSMSSSLGMSSKAFIGMSSAIGLAAVAAADLFDLLNKRTELNALDIPINAGTATIKNLEDKIKFVGELKKRWDIQLFDFFKSGPIGKSTLGETTAKIGDEVIKSLESQISRIEAAKPLQKLLASIVNSPMDPKLKADVTAQIQTLLAMYANESNWKAGYGATADAVAAHTRTVIALGIQKLQTTLAGSSLTAGLTGALRALFVKTFKGVEFTGMTQLFAMDPKPLVASSKTLVEGYNKVFHAIPPVINATKTLEERNKVGADFMQRFADANAIAANKMSDFEVAIQAGNDKFNEFVKTTELGAVTNKRYHDALLQTVGAQVQLPPALDLTTSQLESVQTALDNAAVGLTENSNASKILADALDQQLAPSIQKLGGALTALNSKEFKKAFKDLDFGEAGKKFKEFASDLDKNISKINKESGRMETIFSQLSVALSIDKLPHKQWVAGLEGIRKEIDKIGKTQKIDLSGITTFIAKAETIKDPVQLAKYQKVIALIVESSKGGFNATELDAINTAIKGTGESAGTAAPKLDAAQAALVKFGREASAVVTITASMSASMVTSVGTAVDFVTKALGGIANIQVPTPNESTYQKGLQLAIDNAAQTVKFITTKLMQISGIKVPTPNESKYQKGLQLAIDNAAQTKKFIEKELNKIGGIKVPAPKFNNFNSALDQAVSDAKRAVRDINNALTKVKKPSGGGGGDGKGPGATTGPFNSDTSNFSKSNSGDIIIETHQHVMDQDIVRRFKAEQGKARYRFGLG